MFTKRKKKILSGILTPLLMVVGLVVAGGASAVVPASVSAEQQPRYCSETIKHNCLEPIKARVWTQKPPLFPEADCKIYFRFFNPNDVTVPRTITVFFNGEEFFGDDDFLPPGFTSTPTFGPLPDGEWRVVVSSLGTVFADKTFNFNCGA
jgi:hypothetical protein